MNRLGIVFVVLGLALAAFVAQPVLGQEGDDKPAAAEKAAEAEAPEEAGAETAADEGAEAAGEEAAGKDRQLSQTLTGATTLLAGISVLVLSGFALFAFLLLIVIAFPQTVVRVQEGMETRPTFSFFLGLANVLFAMLLVGALANGGHGGGIMACLILLAFLLLVVFGLSGRAQALGARAMVLAERKPNAVANLAIGWWVLYLVGIIPIVGWILFAYWATSGVGAVLVSIFGKKRPRLNEPEEKERVIDTPDYTV
ncbi:MAG: hypothetical protein ACYS47_02185 [Planctomycetota bacterium]|jgi:hypothetical protein